MAHRRSGQNDRSYLRPASPVDVDADGAEGAAAADVQVGAVEGLHHAHEVPTAVLQQTQTTVFHRGTGDGGSSRE